MRFYNDHKAEYGYVCQDTVNICSPVQGIVEAPAFFHKSLQPHVLLPDVYPQQYSRGYL